MAYLHLKSSIVCIITRSPFASLLFKGLATKGATLKWTAKNITKTCGVVTQKKRLMCMYFSVDFQSAFLFPFSVQREKKELLRTLFCDLFCHIIGSTFLWGRDLGLIYIDKYRDLLIHYCLQLFNNVSALHSTLSHPFL